MSLKCIKIKSSENWYIRGTVKGIRVYKSTGTSRLEIAEAERIKLENDLLHQGVFGVRKSYTFIEAADRYLASGKSPRHLSKVVLAFENDKLENLGQKELDDAAREAYPNCKPQTLNRQFYTPFISVMTFAAQDDMVEYRKWRRPKVKKSDQRRVKWFTYEDARKFYEASAEHLKDIFIFCIYTGARITESIELEVKDLDLKKRWAVLNATKTESFRGVPVHSAVIRRLTSRITEKQLYVLPTDSGRAYKSHRKKHENNAVQGGGYYRTAWNTALKDAGLEGYTPYSTRHTLNNWLILSGIDQTTREAIMGHRNSSTNAIYSDIPDQHLIDSIDCLPDFTEFSHMITKKHDSFTQSSSIMRKAKIPVKSKKDVKNKG